MLPNRRPSWLISLLEKSKTCKRVSPTIGRPWPWNIWGYTLPQPLPPYTKLLPFILIHKGTTKMEDSPHIPLWMCGPWSIWPFSLNSYICFKHCPFLSPYAHLITLQVDLINFVWNYKRHRIPHSVLMASRSDGGLALPNLVKYYKVTQLHTITSWFLQRSYNKWT